MITLADLLDASNEERMRLMRRGHRIDPSRLDDVEYRGVSLGLPAFVERLTWTTFQKVFHRDPESGQLRGWNVRVEQRGLGAESVPQKRGGDPFTFGHFLVTTLDPERTPRGITRGLLLDYGKGGNPRGDVTAFVRDPIVALDEGSVDLLLGWTYVHVAGMDFGTPSFFSLERERAITHVAAVPRPG